MAKQLSDQEQSTSEREELFLLVDNLRYLMNGNEWDFKRRGEAAKLIDKYVADRETEARIDALRLSKKYVENWRTLFLTNKDKLVSDLLDDEVVGDYAVNIRDNLRKEILSDIDNKISELQSTQQENK